MDKRAAELLETIQLHNAMYRRGRPMVSDSVYDREVEMLRELDPNNDWFKAPEPAPVKADRKRKLPIPMKSLDKAKSLSELRAWMESCGLTDDSFVVIMPKFDGLSLLCDETTGAAWSRGGAENEGQDCTEYLKVNGSKLDTRFHYTFGEFVFSVPNWEEKYHKVINPDTGKPFKSPRNVAAGLLNRDTTSPRLKDVTFFRYGVGDEDLIRYSKFSELISALNSTYGQSDLYEIWRVKKLDEYNLEVLFNSWRRSYYIDGLVIYVNELEKWTELGRKETSGNPNYAIAYKHPDFTDTYETTVKDITWKVSKSGALKPVVEIEPVDTGDCEMNSPTGYNASWIDKMRIAPGARVLVTRSGGVIPKILGTMSGPSLVALESMRMKRSVCPSCGSPTKWDDSRVELCCSNPACPGRRLACAVFFYTVCGAENMGEDTIAKMFNEGYTSIKFMLDITFMQLMEIDGFGEAIANTILSNNNKIKRGVPLPVLMQASNVFPGIGTVKAEQILKTLPAEMVESLVKNEPISYWMPYEAAIEHMNKTMQMFWKNVQTFQLFIALNELKVLPMETIAVSAEGKCKGMSVCFSGIRDKELEKLIISEGGKIASGVSGNTTHLVVKDPSATSMKINRARAFHVEVMKIDDFKAKFL